MKIEKFALFGKTKAMEVAIDGFLDTISNGGMSFEQGIAMYLEFGPDGRSATVAKQIKHFEAEGNRLRREIEIQLYAEMLIPDFRADVLSLLEDLNFLLGLVEDAFLDITVEKPEIEEKFKPDYKLLTSAAIKTLESLVLAARAFFRNITAVHDHLNKVGFHEEEADQVATRLKGDIFGSDLGLDRKMHLRYFLDKIDNLADEAEKIGDSLAISSLKRSL